MLNPLSFGEEEARAMGAETGKLRVIINMFGRPVPTELSFHQVEKLS